MAFLILQNVCVLNPGTWGSVFPSVEEKDFAGVVKVKDPEMVRGSWLVQVNLI